MKKSKKLGLQSLALILMSFVLVAGVAFGMTGAWFADQQAKDQDITLANGVKITLSGDFADNGDGELDAAFPGDTIAYTGTVAGAEGTSDFFLRVKVTYDLDAFVVTEGSLSVQIDGVDYEVEDGEEYVYLDTAAYGANEGCEITISFTIDGAGNGNDKVNAEGSVSVLVQAIQSANYDSGNWEDVTDWEGKVTA